ncbi:MAG: hypothetical protein ACK41E_06385 [Deinococcales bacterium]
MKILPQTKSLYASFAVVKFNRACWEWADGRWGAWEAATIRPAVLGQV